MDKIKQLIDACANMDIADQIRAFGDPFLPGEAMKELIALDKRLETLENIFKEGQ